MTKIKGERRKWGEAEAKMRKGRGGGETLNWKLMMKRAEKREKRKSRKNEGGGREKNGGKKVGDQMRQGWETQMWSERRCYFKTVLTDNVTLLQSAKRSCHAPA